MSYANDTPITLPTNLTDNVDDVLAKHVNEVDQEVQDLKAVVGTASSVKGGQADVVARLDKFLEAEQIDSGGGVLGASKNLKILNNATTPASKLDISCDEAILERSAGGRVTRKTASVTVDIAVSGANGLDTGAEAANTWYYVYLIYNGTTTAGLLSISSTAPTMPTGYTHKALVGAVRNDAASDFLRFRQFGSTVFYEAQKNVLTDGAATAETSVSLSSFVPPIAHTIQLGLQMDHTAAASRTMTLRFITGADFFTHTQPSGTSKNGSSLMVPNVSQQVFYLWDAGSAQLDINVLAFTLP